MWQKLNRTQVGLLVAGVTLVLAHLGSLGTAIGLESKVAGIATIVSLTMLAVGVGCTVGYFASTTPCPPKKAEARAGKRAVFIELEDPGDDVQLKDDIVSELTEFGLYILRSGTIPRWREAILRMDSAVAPPAREATQSVADRPATPIAHPVATPAAQAQQVVTPAAPKMRVVDIAGDEEDDEAIPQTDVVMCEYCRNVPATHRFFDDTPGLEKIQPLCEQHFNMKSPSKPVTPTKEELAAT